MTMWLYPISEESGYYFADGSREWDDTSLESFVEMIRAGATDEKWGLTWHFRDVDLGDEIAIYSCVSRRQPTPYIIGLARVTDPPDVAKMRRRKRGRRPVMTMKWDLSVTKKLCRSPINATWLKDRMPQQKNPVTALTPEWERWIRRAIDRVAKR
jgi:hypothetical protein